MAQDETAFHSSAPISGEGFDLPHDDPRRTDNRGGLEADLGGVGDAAAIDDNARDASAADIGITGADQNYVDHDAGAANTGIETAANGQINYSTSGFPVSSHGGPPGVGPVEGSRSGVVAPRVEMTDVGVVDLNVVDISVTGDDENQQSGGARVEDENGNLL